MKNSKFKKALSDEMKHEYESFYSGSEEHIFSPKFEEQMDRLISGRKRSRGFLAVFRERPALRYSLSACTALALCAGVLTIWHNHIKDNISDMEDMVVPPTTQTTVSVPETTQATDSGVQPATTDPTEVSTKVSQDKTETTSATVTVPYAEAVPRETAVTTALIGPPSKPPVVTRISAVTGKPSRTTTRISSVSIFPSPFPTTARTGISATDPTMPTPTFPSPINTTMTTGNGGVTTGQPHPVTEQPVVTKVTTRTTAVTTPPLPNADTSPTAVGPSPTPVCTTVVLPTQPTPTDPIAIVTTRPPTVTTRPTVPVTDPNPHDPPSGGGYEPVETEQALDPTVTITTSVITSSYPVTSIEVSPLPTTQFNTELPHIAFSEIIWMYGGTYPYSFSNYINEWQFENYDSVSSVVTMLISNNGSPERAEVHVLEQEDSGKMLLAVYFMNTGTYAMYIQE